ncbi:hypothetical protein DH2020_045958 [Rehmannia glutinosa]|uniref:Sodium/calcium exchanger membrane region domain-containing protein n=1 Tax=Rehmannia glutinosa TaxID=99300 RepID=A0ABR0UD69_REHGL
MASAEAWLLENGNNIKILSKEMRHGRTAHNMSSSSLRKKSDLSLVSKVRVGYLRMFLANLQEPWVFALSLLGLTPLAERISFLTEQIAFYTGPTVGGLLNATCGNATELIIAILALIQHKKQADVNSLLLLLGLMCHVLPLMFKFAGKSAEITAIGTLQLSRASCIIMLIAYIAYLVFQLWTHRQLFDPQESEEEDDDNVVSDESAVIGFWSAFIWLVLMTGVVALLSEYVVATIEILGVLSVSFISVILLPIVGNAAEHAGAVIFAFKNKLVPLSVIISWIIGIRMDLDFNLLETSALALSILVTTFTLQDGTSHYLKGLVLLLCYLVIGACFFVFRASFSKH